MQAQHNDLPPASTVATLPMDRSVTSFPRYFQTSYNRCPVEESDLFNITCLGEILVPIPSFNQLNQSLNKGVFQYDKPSAVMRHFN